MIKHAVSLDPTIAESWDFNKQNKNAEYTNVNFFVQNKRFSIIFPKIHVDSNEWKFSATTNCIKELAAVYNNFYGLTTATVELDNTRDSRYIYRYLHLDRNILIQKILPTIASIEKKPDKQYSVCPRDIEESIKNPFLPIPR